MDTPSPLTQLRRSLVDYLGQSIPIPWDYTSDAHAPNPLTGDPNPCGWVIVRRREPFKLQGPPSIGRSIILIRVLASHADINLIQDTLADIEWAILVAMHNLILGMGLPSIRAVPSDRGAEFNPRFAEALQPDGSAIATGAVTIEYLIDS